MHRNNPQQHKTHYLMLCELHYPERHGKTQDSDPNIETHYLVYDRFDPITGISYSFIDNYVEYDTDTEANSDTDTAPNSVSDTETETAPNSYTDTNFDSDINRNMLVRINDEIIFLKEYYSNPDPIYVDNHPTIRNYRNIVSNSNYIKPEIGEYIILPTLEAVAILKTFWLRIIQKKWKKVFQKRKDIIKQRCYLSNLSIREIRGRFPSSCINLPGLKGMLSDLK